MLQVDQNENSDAHARPDEDRVRVKKVFSAKRCVWYNLQDSTFIRHLRVVINVHATADNGLLEHSASDDA